MRIVTQKYKGFSLVELLVVIAVIGIGASLSWQNVAKSRQKVTADNACQSIASLVNKTRGYALSGIANTDSVSMTCSGTSCKINSPGEVSLVLQGVSFPSFMVSYPIPYASSLTSGAGNYTITALGGIVGETPITRTLSIDTYKALCQ
jgi:prepilin-type N-terminal cleavage/methylation domain-containing protein